MNVLFYLLTAAVCPDSLIADVRARVEASVQLDCAGDAVTLSVTHHDATSTSRIVSLSNVAASQHARTLALVAEEMALSFVASAPVVERRAIAAAEEKAPPPPDLSLAQWSTTGAGIVTKNGLSLATGLSYLGVPPHNYSSFGDVQLPVELRYYRNLHERVDMYLGLRVAVRVAMPIGTIAPLIAGVRAQAYRSTGFALSGEVAIIPLDFSSGVRTETSFLWTQLDFVANFGFFLSDRVQLSLSPLVGVRLPYFSRHHAVAPGARIAFNRRGFIVQVEAQVHVNMLTPFTPPPPPYFDVTFYRIGFLMGAQFDFVRQKNKS